MLMIDGPQHGDGPHERSLPSRFVRGKPSHDFPCSNIPFSNTAVSTTCHEPVVRPVVVVAIIGTVVRFCGSFGGGAIVWRDWGSPGNAQKAGLDLSELAEVGETVMLDGYKLDRTVFARE